MMKKLDAIDAPNLKEIPEFRAGDTLRVHVNIIEGNRTRVQVFQGTVIGRQGSGVAETFRIRKHSFGVGVERVFPIHAPTIDKIEIVSRGDVRRAKLYYLRDRVGKATRVRELRESAPAAETAATTDE